MQFSYCRMLKSEIFLFFYEILRYQGFSEVCFDQNCLML